MNISAKISANGNIMKYMDLIKNEIDFLDIYMSLRNEESWLVQYITRVGVSKIFSHK